MSPRSSSRPAATATDNHEKIIDYWRRRPTLTEAEWADFYVTVMPLLMRARLPERFNDPARRRELVNGFFQEKILFVAATTTAGPLTSVYALLVYLRNYALGVLRGEEEPGPEDEFDPDAIGAAPGTLERHARLLAEAGIDPEAALDSAGRFVEELKDTEYAYLRHNTCADRADAEPMSSIAARLDAGTSYHFQAGKLGITRSKGETYKGYEHTTIGRWLRSAGAQLAPDWREEIAVLLILLCHRVNLGKRRPA